MASAPGRGPERSVGSEGKGGEIAAGSDKVYRQRQRGLGKAPLSDHARGTWDHFLASTWSELVVVGWKWWGAGSGGGLPGEAAGIRETGRQMEGYGLLKRLVLIRLHCVFIVTGEL